MNTSLTTQRVAVIGASGIGKHHAKWWALEGADVCAFAGSSSESVAKTQHVLGDLFDFRGKGYTDVTKMLKAERPDIVDVCSPNALHHLHVRAALTAGCHVLCEKPFVHAPELSTADNLALARDLVAFAERRNLRIGLCAQFMKAAESAIRAFRCIHGERAVSEIHAELASPARGRGADPNPLWLDLAPHLFGTVQVLFPEGRVDWDRALKDFRDYHAGVRFDLRVPGGEVVRCELIAGRTLADPSHVRELELNGVRCVFEGAKDADGVYCSKMTSPAGEMIEPDMMRLLIREFLAGRFAADGPFALRNLERVLRVLDMS